MVQSLSQSRVSFRSNSGKKGILYPSTTRLRICCLEWRQPFIHTPIKHALIEHKFPLISGDWLAAGRTELAAGRTELPACFLGLCSANDRELVGYRRQVDFHSQQREKWDPPFSFSFFTICWAVLGQELNMFCLLKAFSMFHIWCEGGGEGAVPFHSVNLLPLEKATLKPAAIGLICSCFPLRKGKQLFFPFPFLYHQWQNLHRPFLVLRTRLRADLNLTQPFGFLLWEKSIPDLRGQGFNQCYAEKSKKTQERPFRQSCHPCEKDWHIIGDYVLHALDDVSQPLCSVDSTGEPELQIVIIISNNNNFYRKGRGTILIMPFDTSHHPVLPAITQLWPIMPSARMPRLKESFCSSPLSCACGWANKAAAAAQRHQRCAGKLSIAAGQQRLLCRAAPLASAGIPGSLKQVCAAWLDLLCPRSWPTAAFDQGVLVLVLTRCQRQLRRNSDLFFFILAAHRLGHLDTQSICF